MKRAVNTKMKQMDLKYGNNNQAIAKELIEEWLDIPLKEYKDKWSTFDFYNNSLKILVELKSRRNDSKKYETQLIGKNKWDKARLKLKEGYKVYFFYLLTDGLWCYEVNANHDFQTSLLGNYARNDKTSELVLIPSIYLQKTIPKQLQEETGIKKVEPYIMKWT